MSPPREAPAQACVWPVESRVIGVPRAVRGGAVWSSSKPRLEAGTWHPPGHQGQGHC